LQHDAPNGSNREIMSAGADFSDQNDYHGNGQPHGDIRSTQPTQPRVHRANEPEVLIEFVVVEGPEGDRLHEVQAEAVRWVLTRLAEARRREGAGEEA
jgi:hypothetical protein